VVPTLAQDARMRQPQVVVIHGADAQGVARPPAAGVYVLKRRGIGPFLSSGMKIDIVEEYRDVGSGSSVICSLKPRENYG
jgi:hypothetical protein